ncbi:DUF932 domain-containing protein [Sulfitobacter sp.]|uniref:DUF932 domain-containing protein n=1 Tax=Sulfitobacter sp. TaxID=1903071 RepID=UPI00329881E6
MPFDQFEEAFRLSTWRSLPITQTTVKVADLREALPDFELRPFGDPPNDNPRLRCIVRMPTSDDNYERPVAVVSDQYDLLQHRVMATWLATNLTEAGLGEAQAEITMSEFGERLRIKVSLAERGVDLNGDLFERDEYQPEIEVTNSVDRSSAFNVVLRWRRMICLNGMFTVEEDRIRSIHRMDLSRTQVVRDFMSERVTKMPDVIAELRRWKKQKISQDEVRRWCEEWLRAKSGWTVENCARLWAILETGYDGEVTRPTGKLEKRPLSDYRVGQHRRVPGVSFPVETAYDLAQLLTWITSNQRTVEMQIEGTEDVPRLMAAFRKMQPKKVTELTR